jgi:sodium pump decarboxylase gamma subunit
MDMSLSEILSTGVNALVIGMGIVFLALFILIMVIGLMEKLIRRRGADKESKQAVAVCPRETAWDAPSPQDADGEIVAVIMAAVAAMSRPEGRSFRLRAFRRAAGATAWGKAGRESIIRLQE